MTDMRTHLVGCAVALVLLLGLGFSALSCFGEEELAMATRAPTAAGTKRVPVWVPLPVSVARARLTEAERTDLLQRNPFQIDVAEKLPPPAPTVEVPEKVVSPAPPATSTRYRLRGTVTGSPWAWASIFDTKTGVERFHRLNTRVAPEITLVAVERRSALLRVRGTVERILLEPKIQ